MEKNLNVAPTEQELIYAGFEKHVPELTYSKKICDYIGLVASFDGEKMYLSLFLSGGHLIKNVEPTKAAINAEFEHFNQPLPQWEKPQPHQYSYKGLKAAGKIPHDRSGEDHDSIEAFKKLLAICEALNGIFKESATIKYIKMCPFWHHFSGLGSSDAEYQYQSPIYFTSQEAFDAFKSAPENVELFKTFLKLK